MKLTDKELQAMAAIIEAGEKTCCSREDGWWSHEILMYATDCLLTPRQFAAACGSLAKKGYTISHEYDRNEWHINPTPEGLAAYDNAVATANMKEADDAMLRNAR